MDRSELVPNCSRHFTQGQLLAVRVPDLAGDTRDHGHLERQQRKDTRGMADAKVAVSLDAQARVRVCSPQPGRTPVEIVPSSDAVTPAACECGSKRSDDPSRLAYVLGQVGYDFVSQSRLNSIRQRMGGPAGPEMPRSGRSQCAGAGGTEIAFEALRVEPVRGVGLSVVVDAGRDADLCHRTERPVRPGNVRPVAQVPPVSGSRKAWSSVSVRGRARGQHGSAPGPRSRSSSLRLGGCSAGRRKPWLRV